MLNEIKCTSLTVGNIDKTCFIAEKLTAKKSDSLESLLEMIARNPELRKVYVVDDDGTLLGRVALKSIFRRLFPLTSLAISAGKEMMARNGVVGDVMDTDCPKLNTASTIKEAVQIFINENVRELPVVDGQGRLEAVLPAKAIIVKYLQKQCS